MGDEHHGFVQGRDASDGGGVGPNGGPPLAAASLTGSSSPSLNVGQALSGEVFEEAQSDVSTNRDGRFVVVLPHSLPTGNYHVQVIYPGDRQNPRTTVGVNYDVKASKQPHDGDDLSKINRKNR